MPANHTHSPYGSSCPICLDLRITALVRASKSAALSPERIRSMAMKCGPDAAVDEAARILMGGV